MTNDNRSSIHSKVLDAPLPVPVSPLSEAFEAGQVSLDRLCLLAGIKALQEMMTEDGASLRISNRGIVA